MEQSRGTQLAQLLLGGFDAMVADVSAELARQGHPGVSASLEFALQAIDDGTSSAAELARRLGVSRQAAAKTITALQELGYVAREADPVDARRLQLRVTERGYLMVAVGRQAFDALYDGWAAQLQPGQLELVEDALRKLRPGSYSAAGLG